MRIRPCPYVVPGQIGAAVSRQLFSVLAMFGQIILPFVFILGSLISAITDFATGITQMLW